MPSMNVVFERIYVRERSRLKRLVGRILGNTQDAEDILHDTYLKLSNRPLTESDRGLVIRTATNLALDRLRSRKLRSETVHYDSADGAVFEAIQPERIVGAKRNLSALLDAINALPPRCARVFLLARVDGMTYQQIADVLNISLSTVEKDMAAAIAFCHKWQHMRGEQ